jgi:thymidylate synthase (FAD)
MKITDIDVKLIDHMGSDLSVVNAARVSFQAESEWEISAGFRKEDKGVLKEKDVKLIKYLAKHKHFSPFNHSFITCRVKAPVFVARQLVKHKFMPWNETSRRYVDNEPEFFMPIFRKRAENVKQGSSEETINPQKVLGFDFHIEDALAQYQYLLSIDVAPEQARMVLPQNMMTEWYWSGTLGAYADMLKLRLDPHTQYESRIVAEKIKELIMPLFPVSLAALLENA